MSVLNSAPVQLVLPVTLSPAARRRIVLSTGREPEARQLLEIEHLGDIDPGQREQLIDLRDRIAVSSGEGYFLQEAGVYVEGDEWQVTAFEWLHRRHGTDEISIGSPGEQDEGRDASQIFFAGDDGRTRSLIEYALERSKKPDVLRAALAGAPLIDFLPGEELTVSLVLAAYEDALEATREVVALADKGFYRSDRWWWNGMGVHDNFVAVLATGEDTRTLGLVRESDPKAFDEIKPMLEALDSEFDAAVKEFRETVVRRADESTWQRASDSDRVEYFLKPYARNALEEREKQKKARAAADAYLKDAQSWITRRGSSRLRKAAARGYKHDALYRDERLAEELPGFFAAKARKAGDPLNPSEAALDLEEEVQRLVSSTKTSMTCKLVWAVFDDGEHPGGVYVQVAGFLGRHTVYRSVDEATMDADEAPDDDDPPWLRR